MKFSSFLEKNKDSEFYYLDYEKLENTKDEIFLEEYEREITSVYSQIHKKYKELEGNDLDNEDLELFEDRLNRFAESIRINTVGFKKLIKKYDKRNKTTAYERFKPMIKEEIHKIEGLDKLIYQVSKIKLKNFKQTSVQSNTTFIRKTNKYWVHDQNVMALKTRIVKHLPLYVHNSAKDSLDTLYNNTTHDNAITSIYLDNERFESYLGRLRKDQGAEAIRIRWYTMKEPKKVFIERKKHEEDWTGEESKKLRFELPVDKVIPFLKGEDCLEYVEKESHQLYKEVQEAVVERELRPVLRTFYRRSAFQLPGDPSTRISLDTDLCMVREVFDFKSSLTSFARKIQFPFREVDSAEIVRFPYAILEIKTTNDIPVWINDLVDSPHVEHVHKFSKFMHGCAAMFPTIEEIPYWLPQMETDILRDVYETPYNKQVFEGANLVVTEAEPMDKRIAIPVRVEPKVFFANERTFLSWIQFAIFLGGIGTAMLGLGDTKAKLCGTVLIIVAVVFSFYALYLYHWRARRIREKDPGPYDDLVGPTILVGVFILAMILSVIFKFPLKRV